MTDTLIALAAAWTFAIIMLYAYRRQGQELAEETRQRRRWQQIAPAHATAKREWEQTAYQLYAQRSSAVHSVYITGDPAPVDYILFNEDVTVPYTIGKSPFSVN